METTLRGSTANSTTFGTFLVVELYRFWAPKIAERERYLDDTVSAGYLAGMDRFQAGADRLGELPALPYWKLWCLALDGGRAYLRTERQGKGILRDGQVRYIAARGLQDKRLLEIQAELAGVEVDAAEALKARKDFLSHRQRGATGGGPR